MTFLCQTLSREEGERGEVYDRPQNEVGTGVLTQQRRSGTTPLYGSLWVFPFDFDINFYMISNKIQCPVKDFNIFFMFTL